MIESLTQGFVINALLVTALTGLLFAYLGVHVVARGIVFVDLALGQISMLGVAFAGYVERDPTLIGILFTVVGAFLLSFLNVRDARLKQEALIGIVYAVAAALTVLLISKSPHGDADISEVMFGSFFTVSDETIRMMALVFGGIGAVHLVFRRRFDEVTQRVMQGTTGRVGVFDLWNSLFYLTLGLAIVLAVRVGGVIPVFAYIIVPPVAAILLLRGTAGIVVTAMIISLAGSFAGILFSVRFDFPAGSSVVAILGALLAVCAILRRVTRKSVTGPAG